MASVEIRPIRPEECNQALWLLLADSSKGSEVLPDQLDAFKALAEYEHYDLGRQIVAVHQGRLVYAGLFVPHAGQVAFIFTASGGQGEYAGVAAEALRKLTQWSFDQGSRFGQVLLEPPDAARKQLCLQSGFRYLTDLIYLVRPAEKPVAISIQPPDDMEWITYRPDRHGLFKQTISKTYRLSMDCPELESLRSIDDTITGFRGSGIFNPEGWKLLCQQGEPVGVLLLNRMSRENVMELVYMGLRPEFRGRKLGQTLLNEAVITARKFGVDAITLAVDIRNRPAYDLYRRLGFEILLTRSVFYATPDLLTHDPLAKTDRLR